MAVVAYGVAGIAVGSEAFPTEVERIVKLPVKPPAKSEGYLVVDTKKCSSYQIFASSPVVVGCLAW